jgi:uncharacterized protein YyaL (SSP411 family)
MINNETPLSRLLKGRVFQGCTVISPTNGQFAGRNIIIMSEKKSELEESCDIVELDQKIKQSKKNVKKRNNSRAQTQIL